MAGYKANIEDGREIYIPEWTIPVQIENLTKAGKYLGVDRAVSIAELNIPAVITAIMSSQEPKILAAMIKHFVCQVRIDGDKIEPETMEDMFESELIVVVELFAHVMHSQYHDFFKLGLAKAPYQAS